MALSRAQKEAIVGRYQDGMAVAPHAFLLDYKGIDVPAVTELRQKIRESGASYEVIKNTLALHAIEGQPLELLKDSFSGPIAVAYSETDPVSLAKVLTEFAKSAPMLEFKGGLIDGQPVEAAQIEEIAALPSREELMAKLLFLLQSPITRLAQTLNAITRDFVVVLDQVSAQKESAG